MNEITKIDIYLKEDISSLDRVLKDPQLHEFRNTEINLSFGYNLVKKKEAVEEYSANAYCRVADIVEENGQELYYCNALNIHGSIYSKFLNDKKWTFDSSGIYDAKNNTH